MIKKIFSILLFLFLITGCSVQFSINGEENKESQSESTANKEAFGSTKQETPEKDQKEDTEKKDPEANPFQKETTIEDTQNLETIETQFGIMFVNRGTKVKEGDYIYSLPYEIGTSSIITQGYNSIITHYGKWAYALDFLLDEGTPILSSREGTVKTVVDDFNEGGLEEYHKALSNYVIIEHDDGTFSYYGHNQFHSAKVKVGDKVEVGDELALVGCTGFCSVPHIHFQIQDSSDVFNTNTLPVVFKIDYNRVGKLVEGCLYAAVGNEPLPDSTKDYPEDSITRLPEQLENIVNSYDNREQASEAFLAYIKENKAALNKKWNDLINNAMDLDREDQQELVVINECDYCMNIRLDGNIGWIFDPDPGKTSDDPLGAEDTKPIVDEDSQQGEMLYYDIFSYSY